jgi:hypothetical protein
MLVDKIKNTKCLNLSCFCVLWALINQLSKFGNEEVSGYDYLDIIKEDLIGYGKSDKRRDL